MQQIKGNTTSDLHSYIPNKENPADSASRGLNCCCFQGCPILWQDMKYWPSGDVSGELPNDDPQMKKDITSYSTLLSEDVITSAENRISSCLKLKRFIHCIGFVL